MTAPLDDLMGNPVSEHSEDLDESEVEIDLDICCDEHGTNALASRYFSAKEDSLK